MRRWGARTTDDGRQRVHDVWPERALLSPERAQILQAASNATVEGHVDAFLETLSCP
jgi:hypothetical protein